MTFDKASSDRLLAFCGRLPALPADPIAAEAETRFAVGCFGQRRREIEAEIPQLANDAARLAMLRCEFEAVVAADDVIAQLWSRRFGRPLVTH
jgi:hypothetical protein